MKTIVIFRKWKDGGRGRSPPFAAEDVGAILNRGFQSYLSFRG